MKKTLLISMASLTLFSSCYITKPISQTMDEWMGATEHEVILRMGSPTSTASDGSTGKIIRYSTSNSTTMINPYYNSVVANTRTNTIYVEFYINQEGKVYSWRTNNPDTKTIQGGKTALAVVAWLAVCVFLGVMLGSM